MPSLSTDITSIDSSNVVSLSGGRHLKPNLTDGGRGGGGEKIHIFSSEFKPKLEHTFEMFAPVVGTAHLTSSNF